MDVARSDVVRSCAGRDSGQLFFVVELDESYVYLADGKGRRVEKPKRKKRVKRKSRPKGQLFLVRRKGLEPPTYWFVASHSIQLSYRRIARFLSALV